MEQAIKCTDHNGRKYIMEQSEMPDTTKEKSHPDGPDRSVAIDNTQRS